MFCDDPGAVADWERLAAEAPKDPAIQMLHGLWLGLCAKIRDGSVSPDTAIDIFEQERARQAVGLAWGEAEPEGLPPGREPEIPITPEEVVVFIAALLGLLIILGIAIGIVVAVLIGEAEIRFTDSAVLLSDSKVKYGGDWNYG